jgi:hypothetical protein
VLGMAPGGNNAVESKLGSNLSHIGVTFTTRFSRLKALSASMSRLIANPYPKRADTIGPVSAGWARFILSTRFGEIDGLPIGGPDRPDAFISSENMRRNMAKQGHFIELARVNLAG